MCQSGTPRASGGVSSSERPQRSQRLTILFIFEENVSSGQTSLWAVRAWPSHGPLGLYWFDQRNRINQRDEETCQSLLSHPDNAALTLSCLHCFDTRYSDMDRDSMQMLQGPWLSWWKRGRTRAVKREEMLNIHWHFGQKELVKYLHSWQKQ